MKFSICIPNYNYEKYLGRTIQSVLDQSYDDFEIIISDNASTDHSLEVARSFNDPRIRVFINPCNVGFSRNLDCAAQAARGRHLIMLSSDDLMRPHALQTYGRLLDEFGAEAERVVLTADADMIDADDRVTGSLGLPRHDVWRATDFWRNETHPSNFSVLRTAAPMLLQRSLACMQNPLHFLSTCYPRALYVSAGGYGGNRLINPDKWFHWKLLRVADQACFLNTKLFAYRWHAANQAALQRSSGALKYMMDEYASTLEFETPHLEALGLTRESLERAFIEYDVLRHGLAAVSEGHRLQARRIWHFGYAAYPQHMRFRAGAYALWGLSRLGPPATWAARLLRKKLRSTER